ncbi:MAG: hypothetical protein V3S55_15580 [Nitrospiraceae bacterium]
MKVKIKITDSDALKERLRVGYGGRPMEAGMIWNPMGIQYGPVNEEAYWRRHYALPLEERVEARAKIDAEEERVEMVPNWQPGVNIEDLVKLAEERAKEVELPEGPTLGRWDLCKPYGGGLVENVMQARTASGLFTEMCVKSGLGPDDFDATAISKHEHAHVTMGEEALAAPMEYSAEDRWPLGDHVCHIDMAKGHGERGPDGERGTADPTWRDFDPPIVGVATPPPPPRQLDTKSTAAPNVRLIYVDTELEVPYVFEYDLDEGFAWQYVVDADGKFEMDGNTLRCRRLNGEFRAEWIV